MMCASTPDKVEILAPPPAPPPGTGSLWTGNIFSDCQIFFHQLNIFRFTSNSDEVLNPKKKIFEACAPDLKVNDAKEATYKVSWVLKL